MASPFTDIFTGAPAKKAAGQQRDLLQWQLQQGVGDNIDTLGRSTGYVNTGTQGAQDALTAGYTGAQGALNYGPSLAALDKGMSDARGLYGDARTAGQSAVGAYEPVAALGQKYGGATTMALNSLGVNGAAGNAAARAAFDAGPSYNWEVEQALEGINRRRAAGGMLDSGNADRDAIDYVSNKARTAYGDWQDRLNSYAPLELSATSGAATGRAGAYGNLAALNVGQAGMENAGGVARAGLESERARLLSDLSNRYGINTAGLSDSQGRTLAGLETAASGQRLGLTNSVAQPYAGTYKQEADAALTGSKNLWGMGMAAAQMAMGMPPTSLGSLSGGGNPSSAAYGSNPFTTSGNVNPAY